MLKSILTKFCMLSFLTAAVGCGGSSNAPPVAPTEGRVTYEAKPLAGATVTFIPEKGRPASGFTDENGHFVLTTHQPGDGANLGLNTVTIAKTKPKQANDPYSEHESLIPEKYGDIKKSGLTANVKADENNEFTFELKK